MKKYRLKIILLVLICAAKPVYCQQPDTSIRIQGEPGFRPEDKFRDRNSAWYISAIGELSNKGFDNVMYGLGTSFEYKLSANHSLGAGLSLLISDPKPFSQFGSRKYVPGLKIEYRYYHNLKGRMSRGLTGNNFNANYLLLRPFVTFGYEPYKMTGYQWDFNSGQWMIRYKKNFSATPGLKLGYGVQRTFWKSINLDVNAGFQVKRMTHIDRPFSLLYFHFSLGYSL